jgi:hypothetical protein
MVTMIRTVRPKRRAKQGSGVISQQDLARILRQRRLIRGVGPRQTAELMQDPQHRLEAGSHVRFGPSQGRYADGSEYRLKASEVIASERQVMQEVSGA